MRSVWSTAAACVFGATVLAHLFASGAALGGTQKSRDNDRDADGLIDSVEQQLAKNAMPRVHMFADGRLVDECPQPLSRPVLAHVRPRRTADGFDSTHIAITYVLLYAEDCGALGHRGDAEAFSVFLERPVQASRGQGPHAQEGWRTLGALAIAHAGTPFEQQSMGAGRDIWVSRNKHSNFATYEACGERDADICARAGALIRRLSVTNVGEPQAPLVSDLGTVAPIFKGLQVWTDRPFFEAGALARLLAIDQPLTLPAEIVWNAENVLTSEKDGTP